MCSGASLFLPQLPISGGTRWTRRRGILHHAMLRRGRLRGIHRRVLLSDVRLHETRYRVQLRHGNDLRRFWREFHSGCWCGLQRCGPCVRDWPQHREIHRYTFHLRCC